MIELADLPRSVVDAISNECGPDYLAWMIPNFHIGPICTWHDVNWVAGGSEAQRKRVDAQFFIRGTAHLLKTFHVRRADYQLLLLYYKVIQEIGDEWWDYRDEPRTAVEIINLHRSGEYERLRSARSVLLERVESRVRARVRSKLPDVPRLRRMSGTDDLPPDRLP